jgi:hypothetical protein
VSCNEGRQRRLVVRGIPNPESNIAALQLPFLGPQWVAPSPALTLLSEKGVRFLRCRTSTPTGCARNPEPRIQHRPTPPNAASSPQPSSRDQQTPLPPRHSAPNGALDVELDRTLPEEPLRVILSYRAPEAKGLRGAVENGFVAAGMEDRSDGVNTFANVSEQPCSLNSHF